MSYLPGKTLVFIKERRFYRIYVICRLKKLKKKKNEDYDLFWVTFSEYGAYHEFYSAKLILGFIASNGSYFQIFMEGTVNKFQRYHVIHY